DQLALALDCTAAGQDLRREMTRRVCERRRWRRRRIRRVHRLSAGVAETRIDGEDRVTRGTDERQRSAAAGAELRTLPVGLSAGRAVHAFFLASFGHRLLRKDKACLANTRVRTSR